LFGILKKHAAAHAGKRKNRPQSTAKKRSQEYNVTKKHVNIATQKTKQSN
jgi:hypothetical protein